MSPGGEAMQGPGDKNVVEPVERSHVYTATGDVTVRQNFKDPLLGELLEDKYRIEEVIGWGGMSVVYKAQHVLVDRTVAIKTVKFRTDERPDIWQRFQREVVTLSRLSHPNVVTVYDCVVGKDGQPYVVMDLIQGVTLDDVLLQKGALPLRQLCNIASQVASAVDHAHRHNVIHRDLKPANIMILGDISADDCLVKVVDFGLAKLGEDNQKLTQTGQLWGSPPYISPEQIKGGDLDHRCDIYSLGVVVYEMATGRDPFNSEVIYEMLHHHLHSDPPPFAEVCPQNTPPPELESVVRRALAKDPNDRYQSMADFKEDLEQACLMVENRESGQSHKNAGKKLAADYRPASVSRRPSQNNLRAMDKKKPVTGAQILSAVLTVAVIAAAVIMALGNKAFFKSQTSTRKIVGTPTAAVPPPEATLNPPPTPRAETAAQNLPPGKKSEAHLKATHSPHLIEHRSASEHAQVHHAPPVTAAGHVSTSSPTVKKNLPNASQMHVDQSKFQLLRDLKSPVVRQDSGDLPQR